jgi:hypothetical protein
MTLVGDSLRVLAVGREPGRLERGLRLGGMGEAERGVLT